MIILEFLIFVVSSGLFCSERFRNHIWAVVVAGAIATGSSLLFAYDFGQRMMGHEKEPAVITKIIKQTVVQPGQTSEPATVGKPHKCEEFYPEDARRADEQGVTKLAFKILMDGTVDAITVVTSSGSNRLDEAAQKCVANWHYRPAVKDGQIVEADWKAKVTWNLATADKHAAEAAAKPEDAKKPETEQKVEEQPAAKETPAENTHQTSHHWYDVGSWFSSDSDKKGP
ncbi:MAG: energy transducer TonB [Rhizomicrobium sp.]|nr:energy transducer TonB [Rhizomicrobium sp.]